MLYKFKLSQNAVGANKDICCDKGESAVDCNRVTRWLKKFCLGCNKLDNQTKLGRPKFGDSEAVLQAIEANPVSSTQRISGNLSIS